MTKVLKFPRPSKHCHSTKFPVQFPVVYSKWHLRIQWWIHEKSIIFLTIGSEFGLEIPLPFGISWATDLPTTPELPVPSVVGVWVYRIWKQLTRIQYFNDVSNSNQHLTRISVNWMAWKDSFNYQLNKNDAILTFSTLLVKLFEFWIYKKTEWSSQRFQVWFIVCKMLYKLIWQKYPITRGHSWVMN